MSSDFNWVILTPAIVGVLLTFVKQHWLSSEVNVLPGKDGVKSFAYPPGVDKVMLISAILVSFLVLVLPNSVVMDARPLFNVVAIITSSFLIWLSYYFKNFRIIVDDDHIEFGVFKKKKRVELKGVTEIRYHLVNNGVNLKLFRGKNRVAVFEGGVADFDGFAKFVHSKLPSTVIAKTEGQAHF